MKMLLCLLAAVTMLIGGSPANSRAATADLALLPTRDMTPIYRGLVYPEGLVFDGNVLLFTDMKLGTVLRMVRGVPMPIWRDARCGPTSLAKLPSGQWLLACHHSQQLVVLDLTFATAPKEIARIPFVRPNDMYAGRDGVYVTRSGEFSRSASEAGEIWLVGGPNDMQRVASGIHYANGVAITRDGQSLLVSEHLENRVWRYPILTGGTLGPRAAALLLTLQGARGLAGPDGIEPAVDGSFYVAIYGTGIVNHVGAKSCGFVTPNYRKVTNIALTPDGTGLYAVASNDTETRGALFYVDVRNCH